MRILTLNLLAAALLLFGATSATAYAVNMVARGSTTSLDTSDTVTLDVFLDVDGGIQLLTIPVLFTNDAVATYDPVASAAAPAFGGAGPGGQPTYILYAPSTMIGMPATSLYPQQTPAFLNWPVPPPGQEQVNINYAEPAFNTTSATGVGIWIATLVWHIDTAFDTEQVGVFLINPYILQVSIGNTIPASDIAVSAPIQLTGTLPEPTTAMLIGLGVIGLVVAGRRRA
jgi:hypothetical protein